MEQKLEFSSCFQVTQTRTLRFSCAVQLVGGGRGVLCGITNVSVVC